MTLTTLALVVSPLEEVNQFSICRNSDLLALPLALLLSQENLPREEEEALVLQLLSLSTPSVRMGLNSHPPQEFPL